MCISGQKTRLSSHVVLIAVLGVLIWPQLGVPAITNLKLNDPLVPSGDVESFDISPDGSRVVYRADQDADGVTELYSVPIAGSPVTKLNGALVPGVL